VEGVGDSLVLNTTRHKRIHHHGNASSTQQYTSAFITMAPPLKGYKSEEAAQAAGNFAMTDFFKRARPGRPKKRGNQASDSISVQVRSSKKKKQGLVPKEKKKRGSSPKQKKDAPVAAGAASRAKKEKGTDNEEMKKALRTNWDVS
jgi:hypothetical protein